MKLSTILFAPSTLVAQVLADQAHVWERVNYRGQHMVYDREGVTASPFSFRSFAWERNPGSDCCAAFCSGENTINVFCANDSRSDYGPGADRVIIKCGPGPMIDCKGRTAQVQSDE